MARYAFALTSGSGKTTLAFKYDRVIDIEKGMYFNGIKYDEIKHLEAIALSTFKVARLEEYIRNTYNVEPDLILLVHTEWEAKALNAKLMGKFKVDKNFIEQVIKARKTAPNFTWIRKKMLDNWKDCKEKDGWLIKSYAEIEEKVKEVINLLSETAI
jgi:hypothetical protein